MAETVEVKLDELVSRVRAVRRWLVLLAVLKVAAWCLLFVAAYVGLYALADHRFHLGVWVRGAALLGLAGGLLALVIPLAKSLLGHISCANAANQIEAHDNFQQQLVAAVEYHENKADYPYSRVLADQLVLQAARATRDSNFSASVAKWQAYVCSFLIALGLIAGALFLHTNLAFFSRYMARLANPLTAAAPLPATQLDAITGDIIAETGESVELAAAVRGRVPESGNLTVRGTKKDESLREDERLLRHTIRVASITNAEGTAELRTPAALPEGAYEYQFEANEVVTPWHKLVFADLPKVEAIEAEVTITPRGERITHTEKVKENTLEVFKGAEVKLKVHATEPLRSYTYEDLAGTPTTHEVDGVDSFDLEFAADTEGLIEFALTSFEGFKNDDIPPLRILLKEDQPAALKLVTPTSDYLATNVASVPITFEIADDFGIERGALVLEFFGQEPQEIPIPLEAGAKSATFTHMLELEEYDLEVSDSIVFHATATDVDTGMRTETGPGISDLFFIEIRPYNQLWHPPELKMPGMEEGLEGSLLVTLLDLLEYTRAFVKKTWVIAGKPRLSDADRGGLDSIRKDVDYCAEQVPLIRDDPRYGFTAEAKDKLNEILHYYQQASRYLARHDAIGALAQEKRAYQELRKLLIELEKILTLAPGMQPDDRDKLAMEETVHLERFNMERIAWEMKKLAEKLKEMEEKQKELQESYDHFLEQQKKQREFQRVTDERAAPEEDPYAEHRKPPDLDEGTASSSRQGDTHGSLEGDIPETPPAMASGTAGIRSPQFPLDLNRPEQEPEDRESSQDARTQDTQRSPDSPRQDEQGTPNQGEGQGKGQGQESQPSPRQSKGRGQGQSGSGASPQERMRMLQAKQRALQQQVEQLSQRYQQLAAAATGKDSLEKRTKEHLDNAVEYMQAFDEALADAFFQRDEQDATLDEAMAALSGATRELDLAHEAMREQSPYAAAERAADEFIERAEELSEMAHWAEERNGALSAEEQRRLKDALEDAKRLLESLNEWEDVPESAWPGDPAAQPSTTPPVPDATADMTPSDASQFSDMGGGGSGGGRGAVGLPTYGQYTGPNPIEAARFLARKFWSMAIQAKKRQGETFEDASSDAEFYKFENRFYERAARYEE